MGVPNSWMVYFMEDPSIDGWFGKIPILGHLHVGVHGETMNILPIEPAIGLETIISSNLWAQWSDPVLNQGFVRVYFFYVIGGSTKF